MQLSRHEQDLAAKKELEKAGKPLPLDYTGDQEYVPTLDHDPHPAEYSRIFGRPETFRDQMHVAMVDGQLRYYRKVGKKGGK